MKQRSDKRISTSFSLADLHRLLECIEPNPKHSHVSIPERAACYRRVNSLYTKLRARVALAKLRESQACTAIHATNSCEGV